MIRRANRLTKQLTGVQNVQLPILVTFLVLILVTAVIVLGNKGEKISSSSGVLEKKWNSFDSLVKLDATVEFRNGTDLIWQIPNSAKAVLFLAHGCNGRAANFWDRSPNCPKCVGLPEERLIVLHALARGFAVLTVSSAERCWSFAEERLLVKDIILSWIAKHKLEKLPLVALGASSGGYFVSVLATDLRFSSITVMIAEGLFDRVDLTRAYPPTLFVHMPKDGRRKLHIERYMGILRKRGIDVAEIKCLEFPLSPYIFADRIPGIDPTMSLKLFNLFKEKGFIDKDGYMVTDGRALRWKEVLVDKKLLLPDKSLANHIQEEMNLAFAYHEMTSLQSDQIFDWFDSHMT